MAKSMYEAWDDLFEALKRLRDILIGPTLDTITDILERMENR